MLNRRYKDSEERKAIIEKIEAIRNGDPYPVYREKYAVNSTMKVDDKRNKELLSNRKSLAQALDYFTSFCPILTTPTTKGNKKNKAKKDRLIKKALTKMRWNMLNSQIYGLQETEGDVFFYIYFDKEPDIDGDYIPNISMLKSKNMKNILLNDTNSEPISYIYQDTVVQETIDYMTGDVNTEEIGDAIYIFEKGVVTRVLNGKSEKGRLVNEDDKLNIERVDNKDSYKDIIPIIHIPSDKMETEKFSVIPAEAYIDICLQLIQLQSDIRATNRQLGYPRVTLLDCSYVQGDGRIGGVRIAKSFKPPKGSLETQSKGSVIQHSSASNTSLYEEEDRVLDDLYNLVGVTNPTLMKRVGSSDSSKVLQQVNARMETKINRYVDSIIEAFKKYFIILFKENNVYNIKDDLDFSFEKPRTILRNSKYDDMLLDELELKTGQSTIRDLLLRKGLSEEEIESHFEQMNKEQINGNDDLKVQNTINSDVRKEVKSTVNNANNNDNI